MLLLFVAGAYAGGLQAATCSSGGSPADGSALRADPVFDQWFQLARFGVEETHREGKEAHLVPATVVLL